MVGAGRLLGDVLYHGPVYPVRRMSEEDAAFLAQLLQKVAAGDEALEAFLWVRLVRVLERFDREDQVVVPVPPELPQAQFFRWKWIPSRLSA